MTVIIRSAIKCKTKDERVDDNVRLSLSPLYFILLMPPLLSFSLSPSTPPPPLRHIVGEENNCECWFSLFASATAFIIIIISSCCLVCKENNNNNVEKISHGHCWSGRKRGRLVVAKNRTCPTPCRPSILLAIFSWTLSSMRLYGRLYRGASLSAPLQRTQGGNESNRSSK